MIKLALLTLSFNALICCSNAQHVECDEYTLNGKTFHNVKIVKTSPAWVSIHHSAGVKSCVPINILSNELKRVFLYKPKVAEAWHSAYLKALHNEMMAVQERAHEREEMERIKAAQDRAHSSKLELIRVKKANNNWKTDMRNSRPICKNPSSRRRVVNNHYHYNR